MCVLPLQIASVESTDVGKPVIVVVVVVIVVVGVVVVCIGVEVARLSNQLMMQPACTPIATRAKAYSCGLV